jgi:hypothetical protein
VVHPRLGIALNFTLGSIGTAITLIVSHTGKKFRRAVLGQVVQQSAAIQAHPEAVHHDQMAVACNGFKMSPWISHDVSPRFT